MNEQERFQKEKVTEGALPLRNDLSNVINSISSSLVGVDPAGKITLWNAAAKRSTGFTEEEVIGKPLGTVLPRLVDDLKMIQEVMASHKNYSLRNREYTIGDKTHYEDIHISPLISNEVDGAIIQIDDVTKEYEAEEQLHQNQKMEAIGLMAGGVAHDLNNILTGIISYPELILMDLPPDHKVVPDIHMIKKSGLRASSIVADLTTIARGVVVEKFTTNLNDLVDEYFNSEEFKDLSSLHSNVSIEKDLSREAVNIDCSLSQIETCIMNVVGNATESIPSAGRVNVTTRNLEITNAQNQLDPGHYALLSISGTGPEISKTDRPHLFEPFYSKKKLGRSGTGLGLSMVWNCIQDHHGKILVHSSEKETTFDLYFPSITPAEPAPSNNTDAIVSLRGNGESILVIDDEELQRSIACKILESLNYTPKAVASGEQAIDYIKNNAVDLIILDMMMDPGINGLTTYQEIKKSYPHQRAIISSGYAAHALVNDAMRLGDTLFLGKPYTVEQIGEAVNNILKPNS